MLTLRGAAWALGARVDELIEVILKRWKNRRLHELVQPFDAIFTTSLFTVDNWRMLVVQIGNRQGARALIELGLVLVDGKIIHYV